MSAESKGSAFKRYLSQREAERCENALEPACKCRCQGAKHGSGRVPQGGDFGLLPLDDPHYRPPMNKQQLRKFMNDIEFQVQIRTGLYRYNEQAWRDAMRIVKRAKDQIRAADALDRQLRTVSYVIQKVGAA